MHLSRTKSDCTCSFDVYRSDEELHDDNNTLRASLETLQERHRELKASYNQLNEQLNQSQKRVDAQPVLMEQLKATNSRLQQAILSVQEEHRKQVEALQLKHTESILSLQEKHNEDMERLTVSEREELSNPQCTCSVLCVSLNIIVFPLAFAMEMG